MILTAYLLHKNLRKKLVSLQEAITLFTSSGQPVFYICLALPENDSQFQRFGDKYCIKGTEGAEIIPELQPIQGKIITKQKHSAFFETELDRYLKENEVKEIYLSGLQTQICIMTTAADASFRGYRAIALSDCVLSTHNKNKQDALAWIARYVGEVMSLAQVKQQWQNE